MPSTPPTRCVTRADLTEDHQPDAAGGGAERHAHADLARALRHRLRQYAVQADRGDQRGEQGERGGEEPDEAVEVDILLDLLGHCPQVFHRNGRVQLRHNTRNCR